MKTSLMRQAILLGGIVVCLSGAATAGVLDHWTTTQVSTYYGLRSVAYGNGRYIAVGGWSDWGAILSSEDGQSWTVRSLGDGISGVAFAESVIYARGRFVVVGFWGGTAVSTDGITWTLGGAAWLSDGFYGVTYGGGTYVGVGGAPVGSGANGDINVFTSLDGITWAPQHSTSQTGASLGDVAYGGGRFVAVGVNKFSVNDAGHIYTSTDGINWTQQSIAGGSQVSYCNGRFYIPLSPGTNLTSSSGLIWTARPTGLTSLLGKIVYSHGAYLARAGGYLAASADGINWFQYSSPLPGTSAVASDGQRLVTVGNNTGPFGPYMAPGYAYVSDPLLGIRITAGRPPTIALSGLVGFTCRLDGTDVLARSGSNNWQALTSAQMTDSPWLWTDASATNVVARFYRAALLP